MGCRGVERKRVKAASAQIEGTNEVINTTLTLIPPRRFLRKHELAEWLNVGETTIDKWMRSKVIPFFNRGRVLLFDIEQVRWALNAQSIKSVAEYKTLGGK